MIQMCVYVNDHLEGEEEILSNQEAFEVLEAHLDVLRLEASKAPAGERHHLVVSFDLVT